MRLAILLLLLATGLATSNTLGVCLLDDYTVEREFERSSDVLLAKVVSERRVSDPEDPEGFAATVYTVKAKQWFRGNVRRTLEVFSENSSGRFPMERGQTYLLFLSPDGAQLSADNCGNSGLVSEKQQALSVVRGLARSGHKAQKPNTRVNAPVRPVTALANCTSAAPGLPARYAQRSADKK